MALRDTYRYRMVSPGGRILHSGITKDPPRREMEHKNRWPKSRMVIEGPAVTKETALDWESRQKKSITPDPKTE